MLKQASSKVFGIPIGGTQSNRKSVDERPEEILLDDGGNYSAPIVKVKIQDLQYDNEVEAQ